MDLVLVLFDRFRAHPLGDCDFGDFLGPAVLHELVDLLVEAFHAGLLALGRVQPFVVGPPVGRVLAAADIQARDQRQSEHEQHGQRADGGLENAAEDDGPTRADDVADHHEGERTEGQARPEDEPACVREDEFARSVVVAFRPRVDEPGNGVDREADDGGDQRIQAHGGDIDRVLRDDGLGVVGVIVMGRGGGH